MVCFTPGSVAHLLEALRPRAPFVVHCGTIWVHGAVHHAPATESDPRRPLGEYGTQKAHIEAMLHRETAEGGVRSVVLHSATSPARAGR